MQFTYALVALLPALALGAPTEAETLVKSPVTCTKPESPIISFFKPAPPNLADCIAATNQIKHADSYAQGSTVTFKTCSVTYSSANDIDGEALEEAAKAAIVAIVQACKTHQGTYSADGPEISVKKPSVEEDS